MSRDLDVDFEETEELVTALQDMWLNRGEDLEVLTYRVGIRSTQVVCLAAVIARMGSYIDDLESRLCHLEDA